MKQNILFIKSRDKIFTIPNALSFFRICLIPLIVWLYALRRNYLLTGITVIISGLTDVVDGYVARKYNATSDLGKVLDPLADKSTQAVVMILMAIRYPFMALPISVGIAKELFMAISGYMVIRRREVVLGAGWHGKLATFTITATMVIHLLWYNIDNVVSTSLILLSTVMIIMSLILYAMRNYAYLFGDKTNKAI